MSHLYSDACENKIPYQFFPMPKEFMSDEFLNDPCMMKLVRYILRRISISNHVARIKSNGWHNVQLKPYEFIFGREACAKETGMSDREIRTRMKRLATSSYVSSSTSSSTSSFTVYRLMTESFKQNTDQQNDQQNDQQFDHKQEMQEKQEIALKKEASKKENVHNFETPLPPKGGDAATLPLFHKETKKNKASQDEIDAVLWSLSESVGISNVPPKTIRIWIEKYSAKRVVDSILLLKKRKTNISNKMGWIQDCLKNRYDIEDQNMIVNREFFMKFKEEKGLNSLVLWQTVAKDKDRDFEFDFKRNPEEIQDYARRKYGF